MQLSQIKTKERKQCDDRKQCEIKGKKLISQEKKGKQLKILTG